MAKKRVLLVHNFYQIGGGEHTVFENEKNLLLENGHEVYTYTRSNDELKTEPWKLALLPFTTLWSFRTYFEVRKLIREKNIDIVHCHNTFPLISPSVYYAARSLKIPVVQTIHNFRFLCPNGLFYCEGQICEKCREQNSFLPALQNKCYRNSTVQTAVAVAMLKIHRWLGTYKKINYVFLTDFNKQKFSDLIDIHGDNIFVKPNFVQNPAAVETAQPAKNKFLFAGRLDEYKGIPFLLDVWPTLPKEHELHIYGDGVLRDACEQAAAKYDNIQYLGFQPREAIFNDLADSAALLFTSTLYEGFPMMLAECFSIGRPAVSADRGNHGNIVRVSGGGVLYKNEDKESFRNAVTEIVRNNGQYAAHAAAYYKQQLTSKRNYEMLCDIYEKSR